MPKNYSRIISTVRTMPLALMPEKLVEIEAFLLRHTGPQADGGAATGLGAGEDTIAAYEAKGRPAASKQGTIAVLPIFGVLAQRMDMVEEMSGGTSTEKLSQQFKQLVADPSVKAIVLNIDSPGGSVFGTQELAETIFHAREQKHIVAIANSMACSAAYWIGSAADELVVTPSGIVGSIGVITVHEDWSKAFEEAGVTPTIIEAGKFKSEGTYLKPLTEEARERIQADIDFYYGEFVATVARNRGISAKAVRDGYGQGRAVTSETAKQLGMVDRIDTLDGVLSRLGAPSGAARTSTQAAAEQRLRLAEK